MKNEMRDDNLDILSRLKDLTPLRFFDDKDFHKILKFSTIQKYNTGDTVFEEGSFDNRIFLLISGSVSVMKKSEDITVLKRTGDIFGEMCVIDGTARSASIRAKEDTICMSLDVSFIEKLPTEDRVTFCAAFYQILAEVLAQRLRRANEELVRTREELHALKRK